MFENPFKNFGGPKELETDETGNLTPEAEAEVKRLLEAGKTKKLQKMMGKTEARLAAEAENAEAEQRMRARQAREKLEVEQLLRETGAHYAKERLQKTAGHTASLEKMGVSPSPADISSMETDQLIADLDERKTKEAADSLKIAEELDKNQPGK